MKKSIQIFSIFCFALFWGQSNFGYNKTWGTYYGPIVGVFGTANGECFLNVEIFQDNIYINEGLDNLYSSDSSFDADFYNQFKTEGVDFDINASNAMLDFVLSTDGGLEEATYREDFEFYSSVEYLHRIDGLGNMYSILKSNSTDLTASPNVWFSTEPYLDPTISILYNSIVLIKRDASGQELWRTFIPSSKNTEHSISIDFDEENNLYLCFTTHLQSGISTPNTYQEEFTVTNGESSDMNTCIVKLNPEGQLVWGTYLPADIMHTYKDGIMAYHDNDLYVVFNQRLEGFTGSLATEETYQQDYTKAGVMKLNAETGQRLWGTYFGPTDNSSCASLYGVQANETGVYVLGIGYLDSNHSYYSFPRKSHQSSSNGGVENIISKFSHNGQCVWSTYYGTNSSGLEILSSMSLVGEKLFFTGFTTSEDNISTSGAFQEDVPNGIYKPYFISFNTDGAFQWCSYVGNGKSLFDTFNIKAINEDTFYLWGMSTYNTSIPSDNAIQPTIPLEYNDKPTMYIMRFDTPNSMATSETSLVKDLVLYDNPNDGQFSIKGNVLSKGNTLIKIYDTTGRLVFERNLPKKKTHQFQLQHLLTKGNYVLEINRNNKVVKTFKLMVQY